MMHILLLYLRIIEVIPLDTPNLSSLIKDFGKMLNYKLFIDRLAGEWVEGFLALFFKIDIRPLNFPLPKSSYYCNFIFLFIS